VSCPHFWVPLFFNRRDLCGWSMEKSKRGSFNVTYLGDVMYLQLNLENNVTLY
jgi:hypothetical protein